VATFAGVMSGTSLDGADAAIVEFLPDSQRTLAFASVPFSADLRSHLLALSDARGDTLDAAGAVSVALADCYAEAFLSALEAASIARDQVLAIGCHGQTVRHRPERGFTLQLNDPARLAERCGVDVVADFRRRDVAAGGQGAPLAPAFHDAAFRSATLSRAVVNIGGISNVSLLPQGAPVTGFDCGPGNVLLDGWTKRHLHADFDADGAWAARGKVSRPLLEILRGDEYFELAPPKSTGRERFNMAWLDPRLSGEVAPEDVQATLVELTASTIVDAIDRYGGATEEIYLCGGGARNPVIRSRISALGSGRRVADTAALGVPSAVVECAAFAWLAMKCVQREPVDLSRVTGARGPRVMGAIYPR
jgi:anhydro-N-acetylmuramic acid kinase